MKWTHIYLNNKFSRFRPKLAPAYLNFDRRSESVYMLTRPSKLKVTGLKDPAANAVTGLSATFHHGKLMLEGGNLQHTLSVVNDCLVKGHGAGAENLLEEAHKRLDHVEEAAELWYLRSVRTIPSHITTPHHCKNADQEPVTKLSSGSGALKL